ncbi:MAG: acyl-ACP--UDP-N-acetylglucosamine O-acyltransferase [Candidatus Sumerlaeota bacterium]|nr:acyl-ACP--UDP-N-acetylglucosamine O-acyltransferase [Candidatus Sumerlaeota bacterium]
MPSSPNPNIHPTAIIDPSAQIDPTTQVGPYCVILGPVVIGPENVILAHSYISGHVVIGAKNKIGPSLCIGTDPQSIGHHGDDTGVTIGDGNIIREFATIHRSITSGQPTRVGNDNFIMSCGHIAHDCVIGNQCILTPGVFMGGHCHIGDRVNLSSPIGIHQFVRIGRLAMIGGGSVVTMDVPPFMLTLGRNTIRALNVIGMRRAGIGSEARKQIKQVYKTLYLEKHVLSYALELIKENELCPEAREIVEFCKVPTKRGIMPHAQRKREAEDEPEEVE